MRRVQLSVLVIAVSVLLPSISSGQADAEKSKSVAGGGISAAGWMGKIDANEAGRGMTLNDAKLVKAGDTLKVTTGPATAYWNPANKASGNYTVTATFTEPEFMGLNDHAHPYGIVIGGNDMGTDAQSYLYCAVYGDGRFIVRGFGPAAFKMNGGGAPAASAHKAEGKGKPVSQVIAMSVKGDNVECSVNGTVVGTYAKADLVGAGKLKSTDGIYGIRFSHNTGGYVTGLKMTK